MTLPASGQISMNDINTEFSYGNGLNFYRGVAWFKEDGTTGTFPSGQISFSDFYGKRKTSPTFTATISSNQQELNLRTWAVNNGWNQSSQVIVTINNGVYIWSDNTSVAGLTINGSWPNGVQIINNGYIIGRGGDGGSGDLRTLGGAGGPAISLGINCTITNNGYIAGGGGGGNADGYDLSGGCGSANGGGGGGAGGGRGGSSMGYAGGTGGTLGAAGSNGSASTGARIGGGGGGRILPGTGGSNLGYGGGAGGGAGVGRLVNICTGMVAGQVGGGGGGGWGAGGSVAIGYFVRAGSSGDGGSAGNPSGSGLGGAGGKAIALNGYSCTTSGTGTTYGAVS